MSDAVKSVSTKTTKSLPKSTPKSTPKAGVKSTETQGLQSGGNRGITPVKSTGTPVKDEVKLSKEVEDQADSGSAALLKSLQEAHGMGDQSPTVGDLVIADARSHLGTKSQDIEAPNYKNTGGNTNNCANFASTMLHNRGLLPERIENVRRLEKIAQENGYRLVSQEDAKPGDLAFRTDTSHVELVSQAGGTHTIGSNNENPDNPGVIVSGQQWVTERSTDDYSFRFYSRAEAEN